MNKLLTFEGGQPFTTGDIDFLQECYSEAIGAIGKGLCQMNVTKAVLWGIASGGTIRAGEVEEGAVLADGEVLFVTTKLTGTSERYLCFRAVDSEERTMNNGTQQKVYRKYDAYLSSDTDGAYKYIDLTDTDYLENILRGSKDWELSTLVELASSVSGEVYKKNQSGEYWIKRIVKPSSSDNLLFTYPFTGAEMDALTAISVNQSGVNKKKVLVIYVTAGECRVYNADGTAYNDSLTITNVIAK